MFSNDVNKEVRDDDKDWRMKWFEDEMVEPSAESGGSQELGRLKADEVDEIGALTSTPDAPDTPIVDPARSVIGDGVSGVEMQGGGTKKHTMPTTMIMLPQRPQFPRVESQARPPLQPPPAPQGQQQQHIGAPTDSLSLLQLKRLVNDMPKFEPAAYTFVYQDTTSFPEELEEWFTYSDEERSDILHAKTTFEKKWDTFVAKAGSTTRDEVKWIDADISKRRRFVESEVAGLEGVNSQRRGECLESLVYIGLGAWGETAGLTSAQTAQTAQTARRTEDTDGKAEGADVKPDDRFEDAGLQIDWMMQGAELIYEAMGVQAVFDVLRGTCLRSWDDTYDAQSSPKQQQELRAAEARELRNALTMIYLLVEVGRRQIADNSSPRIRDELTELEPSYLGFLVKILAKLRWDDSLGLPVPKLFLLFWKSMLLLFGGTKEIDKTKEYTRIESGTPADDNAKVLITASPLDYHLFRQELISKYPAYNPPPPLLPLELENNSILPPLPNHPSRATGVGFGPANVTGNSGSILHQPVHIATPAPSPPPSPVGPGGKAGKKQNYQTNQNFPFLYPPLDSTSNSAGGKGAAGRQDALVGKKWEGSDVPTSILEAGELFAKRMRMTRAMEQLWAERERYMKFERGWGSLSEEEDVPKVDPAGGTHGDSVEGSNGKTRWEATRRLQAVEDFYREALPHLQSLVIVLLKVILANVTTLITQSNSGSGQNGLGPGFHPPDNGNGQNRGKGKENGRATNGNGMPQSDGNKDGSDPKISIEELDNSRTREITGKAVSGALLLILKWFKLSHILKFEYMTQLLLDSNYLPLILKLFAHQEMEKVVDSKTDRENLSRNATPDADQGEESEDEACPPPIVKLRREPSRPSSAIDLTAFSENPGLPLPSSVTAGINPSPRPPEVDELGHPLSSDMPLEPITSFSWRNFFSSINYLRIMQKICKHKAHRNLLLVQYKSSTILKKSLKVPQPELRLYTLKLFKGQVPYCGRKWRQSNMRVITAVYLYCRPELRDDWLAGSDVDADVEEALPLEQALRALTHWHNIKRYPEQMGADMAVLEEEQDFFVRELEKMDFGEEENGGPGGEDAAWEGGPLQMEGW
ncbi:hypothetical protein FGG08_003165 [Glutinoglossum americanum]|uniref:Uncharacterized protein n=1 Tax=Glutinoglossum americanum TaxID=1670608 RepID=A0A9P8I7Q5_9PEZI|nr:hypothetical protein FGG08_003165 [Glutinoglossum americanum]